MRWSIGITALVVMVVALYAGTIIAANSGVDVMWPEWIHPSAPQRTACQETKQFMIAAREFDVARSLMQKSQFAQANVELDRAIRALGNRYGPGWPILDDTGLALGAAEIERSGNPRAGVTEKCRVLRDRLELCGEALARGLLRQHVSHLGTEPGECPS